MLAFVALAAYADPLVAIVVVDQEAREQGYAVELEDLVVEDALPIDVAQGEHVRIVDPDGGRHDLDVAPGEAWEVTGPQGEAWMSRLGEEVRTDVLVVRGTNEAIRALADALHADARLDGDRVLLVREGILFDAPWVRAHALDQLDEVGLVRVDDRPRAVTEAPAPLAVRPADVAITVDRGITQGPPSVAIGPTIGPTIQAPTKPVVAPEVVAPAAAAEPDLTPHAELDPEPYVGMYLCAMGGPLVLSASGAFSAPGATGDWYVSAPGVLHLDVDGALWARASIEVDRRFCRAVW